MRLMFGVGALHDTAWHVLGVWSSYSVDCMPAYDASFEIKLFVLSSERIISQSFHHGFQVLYRMPSSGVVKEWCVKVNNALVILLYCESLRFDKVKPGSAKMRL